MSCASAARPACGRSSCPAWPRARPTNTRSSGRTARRSRSRPTPVGFGAQHPPETASIVRDITGYGWRDGNWMETRAGRNARSAPISIYEVHLGSWRRKAHGRRISYREAAEELVGYATDMGFTHLELLPVSEYPFDGSWGYQPVGLYAPTIRHGPPHEFRDLVDAAHLAGLGVILDWVPGHFPSDPHGLGRFDGTALYEHADPKEGFHKDWNTLIYKLRAARGLQLPARQRLVLARGIPHRRAARGCRGLDALPRLLPRRRRMGAQHPRRQREPRGDRVSKGDERGGLWRASGRHDGCRGKHLFPEGLRPGPRGRPRLRVQVEHGLDERHAALHGRGSGEPEIPP